VRPSEKRREGRRERETFQLQCRLQLTICPTSYAPTYSDRSLHAVTIDTCLGITCPGIEGVPKTPHYNQDPQQLSKLI